VGVVQDAMLSRTMRFKRKSIANLVIVLGNGFTTLGFALAGAGVWALVAGSMAGSLMRPIALSIAARHWCRPRFSGEGLGEMLNFGKFVTTSKVLWYVYSNSDVFIIGKILGKELLGFYSIAMQLASLPMQKVAELLDQVGFAAYSTVQHDMAAVRSHFLKAVRILSFLSFPIFWGISSISPELVDVVLGKRWEKAILPLQLLALVMPIRMIGHGTGSPLMAIGKPQIGTLNMVIALVIMTPAFAIGAYFGGLVGVSLAWVVAYPILIVTRLHFSLPPLGLTYRNYFGSMAAPAVGGAVMYSVVIAARETIASPYLSPVSGVALLVILGATVYPAFMWLFFRELLLEFAALARRNRNVYS
jgi:O-antigen/teichoic acid export membrane protein